MESKLFSRFDFADVEDDQFSKNMKLLMSLDSAQRQQICEALPAISATRTQKETKPLIESLEEATGLPRTQIARACKQASFFLNVLNNDEVGDEDPQVWAADLVDGDVMQDGDVPGFLSFIKTLKDSVL